MLVPRATVRATAATVPRGPTPNMVVLVDRRMRLPIAERAGPVVRPACRDERAPPPGIVQCVREWVVVTVISVASSTICDAIIGLSAWLGRIMRALGSGRAANGSSNSGDGNYAMLAPW